MKLLGKNIVVTGGSLGIGFAIAAECLKEGAKVTISARDAAQLERSRAQLDETFPDKRLAVVAGDVSVEADVDRLISEAIRNFGTIDGVVHSAAIYGPIGEITAIDPAAWFEAIRINLYGTFLVTRAACNVMKRHGGGRIILLSGGGAATPFPNYTAYATSKVGVVRFTETVALEMAPYGIEINALAPGFVATRLHEQTLAAGEAAGGDFLEKTKRQLEGEAVPVSVPAEAAAFLLSDAAAGITGKFVAAPYDGWKDWPTHLAELKQGDIFTLRRILPRERGLDWQ